VATKKIACLGSGSRYFAHTLADLVVVEGLAGSALALYDIDHEKSEVMARHGRRLAEQAGTGIAVRSCSTLADALDGADFALAAIGGSGVSTGGVYQTDVRAHDIRIPAQYGIPQVVGDTGGPAGMMMALRNIPIYLNICREMERRCPDVVFFNHSNPMAVLCRAMTKYTSIKVIGICHGVQAGISLVGQLLGVPPEELDTVWVGTNHYHWFTRIYHDGRDVYPDVRRRMAEGRDSAKNPLTQRLSEAYGYRIVYPDDAHALEFYPYLAQAKDSAHLPYGHPLGGHFAMASDDPTQPATTPSRQAELEAYSADLRRIGLPKPGTSALAGEQLGVLIEAIALGRRHVHVVNVENRGVIPNLPDYACVEVEGVTDSVGVRPIYTGPAPIALLGLLQKRIAWQELVADAGVKGDRGLALQALLVDEMAILPERSAAMLDELLAASREYLPQFFAA
jgi:alpha-galactosidase